MPLTNQPRQPVGPDGPTGCHKREVKRMEGAEKKIGKKILVVDDEERICEALKKALERTGYEVDTCLSAMDALALIRKGAWAMVICGIKMPGMVGMSLLDRIKEYDPT